MTDLRRQLESLDRRPYPAYKDLRSRRYSLGDLALTFEHVQGDPFAAPSRLRLDLPAGFCELPPATTAGPHARRATADFLQRSVTRAFDRRRSGSGSGKSGLLEIATVTQEVLERTGVRVDPEGAVTLRIFCGLPAAGRRILGREAARLVTERIPRALTEAVGRSQLDVRALRRHVDRVLDQVALREALGSQRRVAFLAEGSLLPRRSGVDDRPLPGGIPLEVPESLAVEIDTPHSGRVRGLGIPRGVTLLVGGGYHGKSTLLSVIARGVYDHCVDDGRDLCVTAPATVSIRAEDGRSVRGVDLRPFIHDLPLGRDTARFDTEDASGSTSQAAAIIESLEAGAEVLLIDEDTAATNFMVRDARMRRLVPEGKEPITPFIDRARELYSELGVSTVLVVGGAGDYLDVADTVIQLDEYRPRDVTRRAREVAAALPLEAPGCRRAPAPWRRAEPRVPDPDSLDPRRGRRPERVRSIKTRAIEFGREEIDISLVAQLVDPAQGRMIGDALLAFSRGLCDGRSGVADLLASVERRIEAEGLESVTASTFGDRARARSFEIAAALNRLRALRLK